MNPAYKADEFRFFLEDSEARIVITTPGADPVREAARALRLPVGPPPGMRQAMCSSLPGSARPRKAPGYPCPGHRPLDAHERHDRQAEGRTVDSCQCDGRGAQYFDAYQMSLADTASSSCLSSRPWVDRRHTFRPFAGAKIVLRIVQRACVLAFGQSAHRHLVSAVPTIHQILLARAASDSAPARSGLRFVRSCSAPLASPTLKQLEDRFGALVIEAYA